MSAFVFQINGSNLGCSAGGCGTTVMLVQGGTTKTASCTGTSTQLNCTVNLTSLAIGSTQLVISSNGDTLTLPGSPMLGGINVAP